MPDEKKYRALIADDQENWRLLLTKLLRKENFQISTVSKIEDASRILLSSIFDIAIIDVRFVDEQYFHIGGIGLFELIQKKSPSTEAIVLSAYPERIPAHIRVVLEEKRLLFKKQPFDKNEFIRRVKELLQNKTLK